MTVLDKMRAIAQTGLHYTTDPYDREQYTRLMDLTVRGYADALDLPATTVQERLASDLGYVSAKVGADAAIFDDDGRVLLVHRSDDLRWGLVSGWVEPGESPAETIVREVEEEVGLAVIDCRLLDVVGRPASAEFGPHGMVAIIFLCRVAPGPVTISHEAVAAEYRHPEDVEEWHANHRVLAELARDAWRARRG